MTISVKLYSSSFKSGHLVPMAGIRSNTHSYVNCLICWSICRKFEAKNIGTIFWAVNLFSEVHTIYKSICGLSLCEESISYSNLVDRFVKRSLCYTQIWLTDLSRGVPNFTALSCGVSRENYFTEAVLAKTSTCFEK